MFENFGERLRRLRVANGLTQAELGKQISSAAEVKKYEMETAAPTLEVAGKIAAALRMPPDELFGC